MLRIRQDQVDALAAGMAENFEDRMVDHIRMHFQQHYETLGDEETRKLIQHGMERSREYGIVSERDVCKYIDLMLVYGPGFDTSRKTRWMWKILNDDELSPREKMDQLFTETKRRMAE